MATRGKKPLVRIILTEFVQTDPQNFKATVQNLTGKDVPVRCSPRKRPAPTNKRAPVELHEGVGEEGFMMRGNEADHISRVGPVKTDNWTVDDFRWLLELPPLDEQALWTPMRS